MKSSSKWILTAVVLGVISFYITLYTFEAHAIAGNYIIDWNGEKWWRSAPSGSLFPWPREPGMLMILSKVNELDFFIYVYLIKSYTLVVLTALMWILLGMCLLKVVNHLKRPISKSEDFV